MLMTSRVSRLAAMSLCIATVMLGAEAATAGTVVLDNTNDLTDALSTSLGSLTTQNRNGKVFTTGSVATTIDTISMALRDTSAGASARTITVELYAVDGSNAPTGAVLGSYSQTLSLGSDHAYHTLNVSDAISLAANSTYVLVFSSDNTATTTSWGVTTNDRVYAATGGFTFDANMRSSYGNPWNSNTFYNAMQMTVNGLSAPAVPGVGGLAAIAGVGLAGRRRRR